MYKNKMEELYEKFSKQWTIKELKRLQKSRAELSPYDK